MNQQVYRLSATGVYLYKLILLLFSIQNNTHTLKNTKTPYYEINFHY